MDLVLLVCLAASPESCHQERVLMSVQATDQRFCMMGAIPTIAEWQEDHPDMQIARWKCGQPGEVRLSRNAD